MIIDFARVLSEIDILAKPFDFTKGGLGQRILTLSAYKIADCFLAQKSPDGTPWPKLSAKYLKWKQIAAPGKPMGQLFNIMYNPKEINGAQIITPLTCTIQYGVTPLARSEATDFQEGGLVTGTNQPPRPFWGISAELEMQVDQFFESVFNSFIT